MGEIKDAGKAISKRPVPPPVEPSKRPPEEPGRVTIPDDQIRIDKKILMTPEAQARFKLSQAEQQLDEQLAALNQAIEKRSYGLSPWQRFGDPVLRDLQAARSEMQKAKADLKAARDELNGKLPIYKLAQNFMRPIDPTRQPDLAAAEAKINAALGRMEKADYKIGEAIEKLPPDRMYLKGAETRDDSKIWRGYSLRAELGWIQEGLHEAHCVTEEARKDVWAAQERRSNVRPFPSPLPPRPTPRDWPPYYLKYGKSDPGADVQPDAEVLPEAQ